MSDRKIIVAIYGKRYYRIWFRLLFWGLTILFFATMLTQLLRAAYRLDNYTDPAPFSQATRTDVFVKLNVSEMRVLFPTQEGWYDRICLLKSDGKDVIAGMSKKDSENLEKELKSHQTVTVTGVTAAITQRRLAGFSEIGPKIDHKTFVSRYGNFVVNITDRASTVLDDYMLYLFLAFVAAIAMFFTLGVLPSRPYRNMRKCLHRLRKTDCIDYVDHILEVAPFPKNKQLVGGGDDFIFSAYDGLIVRYADINWIQHSGNGSLTMDRVNLHLYSRKCLYITVARWRRVFFNARELIEGILASHHEIVYSDSPFGKKHSIVRQKRIYTEREATYRKEKRDSIISAFFTTACMAYLVFSAIGNDNTYWNVITPRALLALVVLIVTNVSRLITYTQIRRENKRILAGVFVKKPILRNKLLKTFFFPADRSYKILEGLLKKCKTPREFVVVHVMFARTLAEEGSKNESREKTEQRVIDHYNQALKYMPKRGRLWQELGNYCTQIGRTQDAAEAFANASELGRDTDSEMRKLKIIGDVTSVSAVESKPFSCTKFDIVRVIDSMEQLVRAPVCNFRITDEKPALTDSKIGGLPYLPHNDELPTSPDGKQLRLVCQINCRDIETLPDFPHSGILQFFILPDDKYGIIWEHPTMQSGFRVLYYPQADSSVTPDEVRRKLGETGDGHFPILAERKLKIKSCESSLSFEDPDFDKAFVQKAAEMLPGFSYSSIFELPGDMANELLEFYAVSDNKVGGHPNFVQEDPRFGDTYNVLLLQLCSDERNIMWGDHGTADFFIRQDDLKALNFSNVLYNWDCY